MQTFLVRDFPGKLPSPLEASEPEWSDFESQIFQFLQNGKLAAKKKMNIVKHAVDQFDKIKILNHL